MLCYPGLGVSVPVLHRGLKQRLFMLSLTTNSCMLFLVLGSWWFFCHMLSICTRWGPTYRFPDHCHSSILIATFLYLTFNLTCSIVYALLVWPLILSYSWRVFTLFIEDIVMQNFIKKITVFSRIAEYHNDVVMHFHGIYSLVPPSSLKIWWFTQNSSTDNSIR